MNLASAVLILKILQIAAANTNCPQNLSNSCQCVNNGDTVKCSFGINETVRIFNISNNNTPSIKLTRLDISKNNLSTLPNSIFDGISQIQDLDLSQNKLNDLNSIIPKELAVMIKKLDISNNQFQSIDQSTLLTMPLLEVLNISGNNLKTVPENVFVNNKYMGSLDLSHNEVATLTSMTFNGLQNSLRQLDLSWNSDLIVDKYTFINIHDLKVLKLGGNSKIVNLSNLDFPHHLTLLDLSYGGIQNIEECIFMNLIDLEYLYLQENPLVCSCHLLWLHKHVIHNQELDQVIPYQDALYNNWTCVNSNGHIINVSSLKTDCSDHFYLEKPVHCNKSASNKPGFDSIKWKNNLNLEVKKEDDGVLLQWHVFNSSTIFLYGYRITIRNENGDEIYTSEILHQTARKYVATPQNMDNGKFQVCLNLLHNKTEIIELACKELSYVDLQIIVGILAGVIFLIPCVVALIYIICLDKKKFLMYNEYSDLSRQNSEKMSDKKSSKDTDIKESKESKAKWTKRQTKGTEIPKITVQDYTLTNTKSTDNILPNDHVSLHVTRSTDPILRDHETSSIEPDEDSGSSTGIRIDIPSDNESGVTNEGYDHDNAKVTDVKL